MWTKRGYIVTLTSSGEACMVASQTQDEVTRKDGLAVMS